MQVTAIIPDKLIEEVRASTHAKTITDSIIKALTEWTELYHLKQLNKSIKHSPLKMDTQSASKIRKLNRKS